MNQAIVSYVLAHVAKIADVNSSDVHTSVRGGTIVLNNVVLRKDTMNKILPVPIERGEAAELSVRIPNPTTPNPLRIDLSGAHLFFPLDFSGPPAERTMEEILQDITDYTILGGVPTAAAATDDVAESTEGAAERTGEETASLNLAETAAEDAGDRDDAAPTASSSFTSFAFPPNDNNEGLSEPRESDLLSLRSYDDDDLRSCRSEADTTDTDSYTAEDAADGGVPAPKRGWFASLRDRATRSMEWIWQRPVEIVFTDLVVTLPCDARKKISFEFKIGEFAVTIKPTQTTGSQQLKIIQVAVKEVAICANAGPAAAATPEVVSVKEVGINVTKVYSARSETLLRSNTTFSFPGVSAVTADEATLQALVHCKVTRDIMMALPPYCRPFASLRTAPSLWPYVASCILARVRDRRQRYNTSLAHLRFFAHSRERYLQLLEDCHRAHTVTGREQELGEAEQDLRYADVILFLRQRVQRRNAAQLTQSLAAPAAPTTTPTASPTTAVESPSLSGVKVLSSTYMDWEEVRIALPANNVIEVRKTSLILRDYETVASVDDILLHSNGKVQHFKQSSSSLDCLKATDPSAAAENPALDSEHAQHGSSRTQDVAPDAGTTERPLFHARQCTPPPEKGGAVVTRIVVAELNMRLRLVAIHATLVPLMDVLTQMGLKQRVPIAAIEASTAAAEAAAAQLSRTVTVALPRIVLQVDDLTLRLDRVSLSVSTVATVGQPPTFPKYGCNLKELSVRSADGAYLLSPLAVKMVDPSDAVVVSAVQITVSEKAWTFLKRVRDSATDIIKRIPTQLLAKQAQLSAADYAMLSSSTTEAVTYTVLESCRRHLTRWKDVRRRAQSLTVAGVRIVFEPLELSVSMNRIQVRRTTCPEQCWATRDRGASGATTAAAGEPVTPSSFNNTHGVHIRVNYLGASVAHTKQVTLSVALPDGLDVYLGSAQTRKASPSDVRSATSVASRGGGGAGIPATVVHVPCLSVTQEPYRDPVSVVSSVPSARCAVVSLMEVHDIDTVLVDAYSYVNMSSIVAVNGGITVKPMQALMRTDASAVMTTTRPYRASWVQVSCAVAEVRPTRVLAVDFGRFASVMGGVMEFMLAELVPTMAYQVFFSGYTEAAACFRAAEPDGCRVSWSLADGGDATSTDAPTEGGTGGPSEEAQLWVLLNPPPPSDTRAAQAQLTRRQLGAFGVLLPCMLDGAPPLVMTNIAKTLTVQIACQMMQLGLTSLSPKQRATVASGVGRCVGSEAGGTTPGAAGAHVIVSLTQVSAEIPLAKMDFWADDVQMIPACPLKVSVETVETSVKSCAEVAPTSMASMITVDVTSVDLRRATERAPADLQGPTAATVTPPFPTGEARGGGRAERYADAFSRDFNDGDGSGREQEGSPASETETTSSGPRNAETDQTTVAVRSWAAELSFAEPVAFYASMRGFVSVLQSLAAATSSASLGRYLRVTDSQMCQCYNLEETGCIFVDGSDSTRMDASAGEARRPTVILFDSCSFVWHSRSTACCVVVCRDTSVLFKNCVFKRAMDTVLDSDFAYVRSADYATGLFAFSQCAEADTALSTDPVPSTDSASVPPAESSAAVEPEWTRRQRLALTVQSGSLTARLSSSTTLSVTQAPVSLSASLGPHSRFGRVRVTGIRADLMVKSQTPRAEPGSGVRGTSLTPSTVVPVCPKVTLDLDVGERQKSNALALNCSLAVGDVFVPLAVDAFGTAQTALRTLCATSAPNPTGTAPGLRHFTPPVLPALAPKSSLVGSTDADSAAALSTFNEEGPQSPGTRWLPYNSWKVLCSLALTPIRVGLPGGELTLAKVTLANAFFWSRREGPNAEAHVDARVALHDTAVWDYDRRALRGIAAAPLFFSFQCQLSPDAACSVQTTVSSNEITLTSNQVRLLTTVAACCTTASSVTSQMQSDCLTRHAIGQGSLGTPTSQADAQYTLRVSNDTGARVLLNTATPTQDVGGSSPSSPTLRRQSVPTFASRSASLTSGECTGTTIGGYDTVVLQAVTDSPDNRTRTSSGDNIVGRTALPSVGSGRLLVGVGVGAASSAHGGIDAPRRITASARTNMATYQLATRAVAAEAHYVELTDGSVLHVISALCLSRPLTLTQELQLRTMFQVDNETCFALRFTSRYSQVQHVVSGTTVGSIPLSLFGCPDINVAVEFLEADETDANATAADDDSAAARSATSSMRERLWVDDATTPVQVLRRAVESRRPPRSCRREFVSLKDGDKVYLTLEYALHDAVLVMSVRPSQPCVRNETCFPLVLEVTAALEEQKDSNGRTAANGPRPAPVVRQHLGPGEEAYFYRLNPSHQNLVRLLLSVHGESYGSDEASGTPALFPARLPHGLSTRIPAADEDEDGNDAADAVGRTASLPLRHERQPRRFQFELGGVQVFRRPGHRTRVWVVGAPVMGVLYNRCAVDVAVTDATTVTSAGSLGPTGLLRGSCGYVPLGRDLVIRGKATEASDPFDLHVGDAGGQVLCRAEATTARVAVTGVAAFFLLRPTGTVAGVPSQVASPVFELLPPVVLVNGNTHDSVLVRHNVYHPGQGASGSSVAAVGPTTTTTALSGAAFEGPLVAVNVPPGGEAYQHWLSTSGYTNSFSFSCDDGKSFSEAVETDLLPGTDWHGRVLCRRCGSDGDGSRVNPHFTHEHRVHVVKKGLCDPAIIAVEAAEPIRQRVVNFCSTPFKEIGSYEMSGDAVGEQEWCALQTDAESMGSAIVRRNRRETAAPRPLPAISLHLRDSNSTVRVALADGGSTSSGLTACLRSGSMSGVRTASVVLLDDDVVMPHGCDLLAGSQLLSSECARSRERVSTTEEEGRTDVNESQCAGSLSALVVRAEVQVSRQSLQVVDTAGFPVRASMDSAAFWLTCAASSTTVQLSVKGVAVDNTPALWATSHPSGELVKSRRFVVQPFSVDLAVRDATLSPRQLFVQSFRTNCSEVTVTVSDLLIEQILRLAKQCAPISPVPVTSMRLPPQVASSRLPAQRLYVAAEGGTGAAEPFHIFIAKATLSEIPVVVSWDRSPAANAGAGLSVGLGGDDEDTVFPLASFVPSLHHASILVPKLQFTELSTASPRELLSMVQQIVLMEVVKQIPRMVSTVSLFPRTTSIIGNVTSRLTSFLFGSDANNDGASLAPPQHEGGAALL